VAGTLKGDQVLEKKKEEGKRRLRRLAAECFYGILP
jgi:hypothetical protein